MNAKELSQTRLVLLLLTAAIVVAAIAVWPTPDAVFAADSDGDGLDDAFEQAFGTDPQASDSDDDNLTDFDEIFGTGTDPTDDDTDNDGEQDDIDAYPLASDTHAAGNSTVDGSYSTNLTPKEARTGTSVTEGVGVLAHSGEFVYRHTLLRVRGRRMDTSFVITYRSGITYNGPVGMNWSLFPEIREVTGGGGDVYYYSRGARYLFEKDQETAEEITYDSPAGFAGTLVLEKTPNEWHLTFPNGYEEVFNADGQDEDIPLGGICQGTPSLSHLGDTYSYAPLVQENALEGAEGAVGDRSSFQGVRSLEHPLQFPQSVASALD
jgi:hypothetical protein